ncbi:hypothetical protein [Amycolatopsis sp. PS_44_ISF1]|uniref:hypothetical protein n=1 Tax=Amycolatopsis sp. PS_44_ISF1 TaxID=2974917 RepID=UPI0028E09873|nr:hypothetical protein [Amycolatopsis sp. PS_44_ISF1]MDT8913582.1 hypothetical protein [Amycolatopsis sp. PS_44_ISF1]
MVLPGFEDDLRALHAVAEQDRHSPESRLLRVVLNKLEHIAQGERPTHSLACPPEYPDLSDCVTTYVSPDQDRKPSHRLVWRERMPDHPGQPITREMIALGERDAAQAYYLAGQRLGRPVGFTLAELRKQREPIATSPGQRKRQVDVAEPPPAEPGFEWG